MMRIGYAKIGRSIGFDRSRYGFQGDAEAPQLLRRLALRNPQHEFIVCGAASKFEEGGMPPNVSCLWDQGSMHPNNIPNVIAALDGVVMHLGQHGTSHMPIPFAESTWEQYRLDPANHATGPLAWAITYGSFLVNGLNRLGDRTDGKAPVVYLCADPRNYLKGRDIKWPTGADRILAQYQYKRNQKHERFKDPRTPKKLGFNFAEPMRDGELWLAEHSYVYGGLELMILPDDWETWGTLPFEERVAAAISTTSFVPTAPGAQSQTRRSQYVVDYLLKPFPFAPVWGKWDDGSLQDVPEGTVMRGDVADFHAQLESSRVTLSLPALGTGWTVAKPYQCFAANVACFMIEHVDDQGWILPSRRAAAGTKMVAHSDGTLYSVRDDWTEDDINLARWLRVETPAEFEARARILISDKDTWTWVVNAQRDLLTRRWREALLERSIETQLGLERHG